MKNISIIMVSSALLLSGCAIIPSSEEKAEMRIAPIFTDNMVLQREMEIPVWGWAEPGEEIWVTLGDTKALASASVGGKWMVKLPAQDAGGPINMEVTDGTSTIKLDNILVGDVWLASGQSNMEWPVSWAADAEKEVPSANWSKIRLLTVEKNSAAEPQSEFKTTGWQVCSPETAPDFSAVAYYFGRELHEELDVPIGLIDSTWGGSIMESWTPHKELARGEEFDWAIELQKKWKRERNDPELNATYTKNHATWKEQTGGDNYHDDPGNTKYDEGWASLDFDDNSWHTMMLPGVWEAKGLPEVDGTVWYRRTVDIPETWMGEGLTLSLGTIDDFDTTYFNNEKVGGLGPEDPNSWATPRVYHIPGELVHAGKNVIAVRVFDQYLGGGFSGNGPEMFLRRDDTQQAIFLAGEEWKYKVAISLQQVPTKPGGLDDRNVPSGLYNGMIHPLIPYAMRGVIWYQGESNAGRWQSYKELSERMIGSWRSRWGANFPFLLVQLAGFEGGGGLWPYLREAQADTLELPNTGMALAIDIGTANDIHPRDKQTVGHRLALAARRVAYGEAVIDSGPVYSSMEIEGDRVILSFESTGSGLMAKDGSLTGFEIAPQGGAYIPAEARIVGESVVVWSPDVTMPFAVRYAWKDFPDAGLYNKEELPAVPFRTHRSELQMNCRGSQK